MCLLFSDPLLAINTFVNSLGVPYHSWRITHGKHHASTAHLTSDQVFVPPTRTQLGLPKFHPSKEDLVGSTVAEEVQKELRDALGDSPIGSALGAASYLVGVGVVIIGEA